MRAAARALWLLAAVWCAVAGFSAQAATPIQIQHELEAAVRGGGNAFAGFSAQRGEQFFSSRHANDWSCASCHTQAPVQPGKHAQTGKTIAPLAPGANPQRFTDSAKVEKWFKRNCNDVLQRPCTPQEKGDVLQYLLSLK